MPDPSGPRDPLSPDDPRDPLQPGDPRDSLQPGDPGDPLQPGDDERGAGDPGDEPVDIAAFWQRVRHRVQRDPFSRLSIVVGQSAAGVVTPPAFAFGGTREQADEQLQQVLDGTRTASSAALAEYQRADGQLGEPGGAEGSPPLPQVGDLAIVLDGAGQPRAVIRTTAVEVSALASVTEEHAAAEGGGDLEAWQREHAAYWGKRVEDAGDWPVVLERFTLAHPRHR